jgi:hypothetical protein
MHVTSSFVTVRGAPKILAPSIAGRTAFVGTPLLTGLQVERQKKSMKKNDLSRLRRDSLPACGQRVSRLHDKRAASSIDVNNLRRPKFGTHIAH